MFFIIQKQIYFCTSLNYFGEIVEVISILVKKVIKSYVWDWEGISNYWTYIGLIITCLKRTLLGLIEGPGLIGGGKFFIFVNG